MNGTTILKQFDTATVQIAAQALQKGQTVVLPTETVYGLGANALDDTAIEKIFKAKGRPQDNPLIVHISNLEMLKQVVSFPLPQFAEICMHAFWPGPLTLVMPKAPDLSMKVSAGLNTVGVRMPDHPLTLAIIDQAGLPVAAPSANLSGHPSPTQLRHVQNDLMGRVDVMVEGDTSRIGLESTVLDLTQNPPCILRPGAITLTDLQRYIPNVWMASAHQSAGVAPKSPGMKYAHYAPKANMLMVKGSHPHVVETITNYLKPFSSKAVLCVHEHLKDYPDLTCIDLGPQDQPAIIAARLYDCLHQCDAFEVVACEAIEERDMGVAVMDRLSKAVGFNIMNLDEPTQ